MVHYLYILYFMRLFHVNSCGRSTLQETLWETAPKMQQASQHNKSKKGEKTTQTPGVVKGSKGFIKNNNILCTHKIKCERAHIVHKKEPSQHSHKERMDEQPQCSDHCVVRWRAGLDARSLCCSCLAHSIPRTALRRWWSPVKVGLQDAFRWLFLFFS